ncbi:sterol desaturase family protein [Sphingomonas sp. LHG3406-1]|uniref:sterol desaturase family protein n=1 Tax=Sphingomonas sp. LHG3406-1 TaxID=2804617 RepID=UPI0026391756|nr:sterol desaturase family protein [Sphingomonas sp. LHG3406-1]
MADYLIDMRDVVLGTAYLILLCTIVELISKRGEFRWRDRWPGILFGLLVPVFAILVMVPLKMVWAALGVAPLLHLDVGRWLGSAGAVLAMLLVTDFLMYWEHRFEHRFLWPVHAVHHSVEHLSASTSYSHPLQFISMFFFISIPLSMIDFGPYSMPGVVVLITGILALFIHSPVRIGFGPFRHLLVDPAYHRIHHSLEERHFDRNFSILFSFWDRLFGTMIMPARDEWPDTGIHEARSPQTVGELLAFPFRLWRKQAAVETKPDADMTLPEPDVAANRQAA